MEVDQHMTEDQPLYSRYNYISLNKMESYYYLTEYDIRQANISILYGSGRIDRNMFDYFSTISKREREIAIGLMIGEEKKESYEEYGNYYSKTEDIIKTGIIEAKRKFVETNKISDESIVRIANDALIVKDNGIMNARKFNYRNSRIEFKIDGVYTSMVQLADVIILFNSENCAVDVKGISNDKIILCEKFLTAICEIIMYIEKGDLTVAKMKHYDLYKDYIERRLPVEYYRELNSGTGYRIKYDGILTVPKTARLLSLAEGFDINKLDISYNLYILRELYSLIIKDV